MPHDCVDGFATPGGAGPRPTSARGAGCHLGIARLSDVVDPAMAALAEDLATGSASPPRRPPLAHRDRCRLPDRRLTQP
ncbi:MAG: hypothetical protein WKF43_14400 [Acidimicrobiales bacterium]